MNLLHGYIMLFVLSALDKETQGSHSQSFYYFSACWMYKETDYETSPVNKGSRIGLIWLSHYVISAYVKSTPCNLLLIHNIHTLSTNIKFTCTRFRKKNQNLLNVQIKRLIHWLFCFNFQLGVYSAVCVWLVYIAWLYIRHRVPEYLIHSVEVWSIGVCTLICSKCIDCSIIT